MTESIETVREDVAKSSYVMMGFFRKLIENGKIRAYDIEVGKRTFEETEDEEIVRVKKGATLTPTTELRDNRDFLIEDPKTGTRYKLSIGSRGSMFDDDGNQDVYHHCSLERLNDRFNPKGISRRMDGGILIPEDMIDSRLSVNYNEDWRAGASLDYLEGGCGSLSVAGRTDEFFERVCEFVRS